MTLIGWLDARRGDGAGDDGLRVERISAVQVAASSFFTWRCKRSPARRCGNCGGTGWRTRRKRNAQFISRRCCSSACSPADFIHAFPGIFVIFGAFLFGTCLHQEPSLVKACADRFSGVVLVAFRADFFHEHGLEHADRLAGNAGSGGWRVALVLIARRRREIAAVSSARG